MENKKRKQKRTLSFNEATLKLIAELGEKMGITDNAVVSVAVHLMQKGILK